MTAKGSLKTAIIFILIAAVFTLTFILFLITNNYSIALNIVRHSPSATDTKQEQDYQKPVCSPENALYLAIAEKYPAIQENSPSSLFQFSGSPMAASWTNGNDIAAYNVANKVSANINGFYTPAPGSLYNAYASLLLSIKPGEYIKTSPNNTTKTTSFDSALSHARYELTNDQNKSNYQRLDGSIKRLPTITLSGNLGTDLADWKAYPADVNDLDITISGFAELNRQCFYASKSNDLTVRDPTASEALPTDRFVQHEEAQNSNYKLRVRFKGFKSYTITFGNWFSPSFAAPEAASISPAATLSSLAFFGKKRGSLHMIPSQIWVLYRPKIELTVGTDFYHEKMKNDPTTNPADVLATSSHMKTDQPKVNIAGKTTTITYESPILQGPYIFGVTSVKNYIH